MKIRFAIAVIAVCGAVALLSGCKKEEPAPAAVDVSKPSDTMPVEPAKAVDEAKSAAKEVTDQATKVPDQATKVTDQATKVTDQATKVPDQAATQAKAAEQQAQSLIDRAKGYVTDQKYPDALSTLNQLTGIKLTDSQQKLVDSLKTQIEAALAKATAGDAASKLGGALGGKQ
jgi:hypothetical protein